MKESLSYIGVFAAHYVKHYIIKCRCGRTYGKDRNTAYQPQQIKYKNIKYVSHRTPERIIVTKDSAHALYPFTLKYLMANQLLFTVRKLS
jgi:hypothetical protein